MVISMEKANSILASYAVYKNLYDNHEYRSSYQIIAQFIKYIIHERNLREISIADINNSLKEEFGFILPDAVIRTSMKNIDQVERINHRYRLKESINYDESFERKLVNARGFDDDVLIHLIGDVERYTDQELSEDKKRELADDFKRFLLDGKVNNQENKKLISRFVIATSQDIKQKLDIIREGSILYSGLNYEAEIDKPFTGKLVLYFATEILFSLVGYNGAVFQELANDLIGLIKEFNVHEKRIEVRIFAETINEIDSFFASAEQLVNCPNTFDVIAMENILRGCHLPSDVVGKKADFFHVLQYEYGIMKESERDYYSKELHEYNLEDVKLASGDNRDKDLIYISHINKLRRGVSYDEYIKCKYLFISNSSNISTIQREIDVSSDQERKKIPYAVNMNFFTNYLWYYLNKGFGAKNFPKHISTLVKARIILSDIVSDNIIHIYQDSLRQYKQGEISKEQITARFIALKEKHRTPEGISSESMDDDLDFDIQYIERFKEESKFYQNEAERNKLIAEENEKKRLEIKKENSELAREIERLRIENTKYHDIETERVETSKRQNERKGVYKKIAFYAFCIVTVVIGIFCVHDYVPEIDPLVSVLSPAPIIGYWFKKTYELYKKLSSI